MGAATVKEIVYERPWLYEKQLNALFNPSRYSIIEASTKSGKTVGAMAWLLEQALKGKGGQNFWWVAPIFAQAKIAYRRMKRGLPLEIYDHNESELTITLLNGTVIWFKGGDKPDSLYGEDVYAAVIDEASRCKEESWFAVRSTLTATNGPARIIGNVKGKNNWYYRLARRAQAGTPNMEYHKITARDAVLGGVTKAAELEDAKSLLPAHVYRELYEAEAADDGSNPFGIEAIERCRLKERSNKPVRAIGIDLAKSVDWTWIVGLDEDGNECFSERWQADWNTTKRRLESIVKDTPALCDSTGNGDPVVEDLQRVLPNFEGFKFSSNSKQQIMEGLAVSLQQQTIGWFDERIGDELESFEYHYTKTGVRYEAPEGLHDDGVCALALANRRLSLPVDYIHADQTLSMLKGFAKK